MIVNFDFETKIIGLDGKRMILQVEATVRNDLIVATSLWYDELAKFVDLKILSPETQAAIFKQVWASVEEHERAGAAGKQRLWDLTSPEGSASYVEWLNRGSR